MTIKGLLLRFFLGYLALLISAGLALNYFGVKGGSWVNTGILIGLVYWVCQMRKPALWSSLFGPDGCFGLAWSVLHLIESAPNWPLADCLVNSSNEWVATCATLGFDPEEHWSALQ